jgi:hypothetical protein
LVATSPLTSSTLQVPQAPALHSYGRPTPARSAARKMVSSAAQGNCAAPSASAIENVATMIVSHVVR